RHIVELLGGDAHLRGLFLEKVDAPDLGRRDWCGLKGDKQFRDTLADARRVLQDMAAALEYLHEKEILHNDIKPANILNNKTNGAVLADVGLATGLTSAPSSWGTPWYVPPEFLWRRQRGAPADLFALGIVMMYLLGYIAIPECEQQAKTWLIAQVHGASASPAAMAMVNWLRVVRDTRKELQEATDRTAQLVLGMLEQRSQDRITACELDTAIQSIRAECQGLL
ncbi:kinase-like protein, partial [Colletotrichum somersetense]